MHMKLPYGKSGLRCDVPQAAQITSSLDRLRSTQDGRAIVEAAMAHPIGTARLEELAAGKRTATVIISDHKKMMQGLI